MPTGKGSRPKRYNERRGRGTRRTRRPLIGSTRLHATAYIEDRPSTRESESEREPGARNTRERGPCETDGLTGADLGGLVTSWSWEKGVGGQKAATNQLRGVGCSEDMSRRRGLKLSRKVARNSRCPIGRAKPQKVAYRQLFYRLKRAVIPPTKMEVVAGYSSCGINKPARRQIATV